MAYDIFLLNLGLYPPEMEAELKKNYRDAGFYGKGEGGLRHSGSVAEIGRRALAAMRKISPRFFDDRHFWYPGNPGVVHKILIWINHISRKIHRVFRSYYNLFSARHSQRLIHNTDSHESDDPKHWLGCYPAI